MFPTLQLSKTLCNHEGTLYSFKMDLKWGNSLKITKLFKRITILNWFSNIFKRFLASKLGSDLRKRMLRNFSIFWPNFCQEFEKLQIFWNVQFLKPEIFTNIGMKFLLISNDFLLMFVNFWDPLALPWGTAQDSLSVYSLISPPFLVRDPRKIPIGA